jgi:hypothetical protein
MSNFIYSNDVYAGIERYLHKLKTMIRSKDSVEFEVRIGKFVHRRAQWVGLTAIENGEPQFTELGVIKRVTGSTATVMPTDYGRQYRTLLQALKTAGIEDTPKQWAKRLKDKRRRARRKQRWEFVKNPVRAVNEVKE